MSKSCKNGAGSLDALFEVLADRRRRYALGCLKRFEEPLSLADLADEVAVRENEAPITAISAEEVKRVYMSLYHTHIPKLEAARVVCYSQEADTVMLCEPNERFDEVWDLLKGDVRSPVATEMRTVHN